MRRQLPLIYASAERDARQLQCRSYGVTQHGGLQERTPRQDAALLTPDEAAREALKRAPCLRCATRVQSRNESPPH